MLEFCTMTKSERIRTFTRTLFRWHRTHYRDMPWRNTRDPYRIFVSEIMLQQTQVDRVRKKYAEFLRKFPTVSALAKAPLADVLRVWSGLGYNRRARYLHECAKTVVRKYGGKFPDDFDTLRALPGIGPSSAAAVLAFAFDRDLPMIDTNIRRILVRVFFGGKSAKTVRGRTLGTNSSRSDLVPFPRTPSDKELYGLAKSLIPEGKGREWNYAMLDLGATLCTARHHCDDCPFMRLHGRVGDFQYKKPQKKFAGSNRFYRGRILHALTRSARTPGSLAAVVDLPVTQVRAILRSLAKEKLVVFSRERARLSA